MWRQRLDAAYGAFDAEHGRRPERVPERDLIRWTVAAGVAKLPRQPVAGVDLVFTPVKSVSVLWALGDSMGV